MSSSQQIIDSTTSTGELSESSYASPSLSIVSPAQSSWSTLSSSNTATSDLTVSPSDSAIDYTASSFITSAPIPLSHDTNSYYTLPMTTQRTNWLPTVIVTEVASTTTAVATNTAPAETSGLPKAITSINTASPADNYILVTIGFKEPLNYPFVVSHSISSAQIFDYLPKVLKSPFGGSGEFDDVTVSRIIPFGSLDTSYIISVAEVYFPDNMVSLLGLLLADTNSKIYQSKDATTAMLALLIDIRVPITGLNVATQATQTPQTNNGSVGSGEAKTLNTGVVAGITVGASVGSLAYMSLMVLLLRRFKKKKNNIEITSIDSESSIENGSRGSANSPMSQNTARFNISVPVNAQNSLGWSD